MISKIGKALIKLARPLFWLSLIAVTLLSLWPGSAQPPTSPWSDKINHGLAYFVLGTGLFIGWQPAKQYWLRGAVLLLLWSAFLEFLQGLAFFGRTTSGLDLAANGVGLLFALAVSGAMHRLFKKVRT